jgi:hypothetical protein
LRNSPSHPSLLSHGCLDCHWILSLLIKEHCCGRWVYNSRRDLRLNKIWLSSWVNHCRIHGIRRSEKRVHLSLLGDHLLLRCRSWTLRLSDDWLWYLTLGKLANEILNDRFCIRRISVNLIEEILCHSWVLLSNLLDYYHS